MGNAAKLMADSSFRSKTLQASPPRDGWGAFMVYAGVDTSAVKHLEGLHHQLVNDQPLGNGNSIFLSISPEWDKTRAPENRRAITKYSYFDETMVGSFSKKSGSLRKRKRKYVR